MNELVTKLMATFFEGLEAMDAVAYPAMKSEYHWWLLDANESPEAILKAEGQILVSELGIYIPYGCLEDLYDESEQYLPLPEGRFYLAESSLIQNHLSTYFLNSLKGIQ